MGNMGNFGGNMGGGNFGNNMGGGGDGGGGGNWDMSGYDNWNNQSGNMMGGGSVKQNYSFFRIYFGLLSFILVFILDFQFTDTYFTVMFSFCSFFRKSFECRMLGLAPVRWHITMVEMVLAYTANHKKGYSCSQRYFW